MPARTHPMEVVAADERAVAIEVDPYLVPGAAPRAAVLIRERLLALDDAVDDVPRAGVIVRPRIAGLSTSAVARGSGCGGLLRAGHPRPPRRACSGSNRPPGWTRPPPRGP